MPNQISAEDYHRVQLATTRESHTHRCWPQEVVRAFAAVELPAQAAEGRTARPGRLGRRIKVVRARLRLNRLKSRRAQSGGIVAAA